MGALLIALTLGVLIVDPFLDPWAPFLLISTLGLSLTACAEMARLLRGQAQPFCQLLVAGLLVANWLPHLFVAGDPWFAIGMALAAAVLVVCALEMSTFQAPGGSVQRMAVTFFIVAYLGFLPSFLIQLRWLPGLESITASKRQTLALALAIFVPKCCDIGAYFAGRALGRHPMAPVLSPKKTWEGAIGGLMLSTLAALLINEAGPIIPGGRFSALLFGLVVGGAGMLGDLTESLIKRDCGQKDASQIMPGFGGVLDVVDAILYSAPMSYCWLTAH
jgi:phosphatidate cytidylyltransferase